MILGLHSCKTCISHVELSPYSLTLPFNHTCLYDTQPSHTCKENSVFIFNDWSHQYVLQSPCRARQGENRGQPIKSTLLNPVRINNFNRWLRYGRLWFSTLVLCLCVALACLLTVGRKASWDGWEIPVIVLSSNSWEMDNLHSIVSWCLWQQVLA